MLFVYGETVAMIMYGYYAEVKPKLLTQHMRAWCISIIKYSVFFF